MRTTLMEQWQTRKVRMYGRCAPVVTLTARVQEESVRGQGLSSASHRGVIQGGQASMGKNIGTLRQTKLL